MKLCAPAVVYLVLAIIALVFNMRFSMVSILLHVAFIGLWTFILNWICSKGFKWVSWGLVVLPYLFAALVWLIGVEIMAINKINAYEGFKEGVGGQISFPTKKVIPLTQAEIDLATKLKTITIDQIKQLTPEEIKLLTNIQISKLTNEQIQAIPIDKIQLLTYSQLNENFDDLTPLQFMALPKKVIQLFLPKQIIKNLKSFSPIQKTWFLPIQVETIPELKGYTLPPGKLPNGITLPNNNYDDDDIELSDADKVKIYNKIVDLIN
uniref:Uncharacterized protein n=1 Tax=viral metagenome TaxID=1070528 RepID=A0A6C0HZI5_9ZZZZ